MNSRMFSIIALLLLATWAQGQTAASSNKTASHHARIVDGYGTPARVQPHASSARRDAGTASNYSSSSPLFLPIATYDSGGTGASAIAVADVNGDGYPDIAVTNQLSNNVAVLLGSGDGTFQPAATYGSGGSGPVSLALADLNGDAYPDIVVVNSVRSIACTRCLAVLLNNGDGTFAPAVGYDSGGYHATAVAIKDVNNDDKPDLLVPDNDTGTVGVLLGNGDGTFKPVVTSNVGGYGSVAVAWLGPAETGWGFQEVIVLNTYDQRFRPNANVAVLYPTPGGPAGSLTLLQQYPSGGNNPLSLAVGDVLPDGLTDIVTTGLSSFATLLNDGDEFVGPFRYSPGGTLSYCSAIGDLNLDGIPDAVVGNWGSRNIAVHFSTGMGGKSTFLPALTFDVGGDGPTGIAIADVNGDGKSDVLVADWSLAGGDGLVAVLLNNAAPAATLSPTSLNFGRQALYETAAKTVKLKNSGTAPLKVSSVTVDGPFAISANTCTAPLDMNDTCQVNVTFTPTMLGKVTGTLTFTDNASDSPQKLPLSGTGVQPATLMPAGVVFGRQAVGTTSLPRTFTLTNNQTVALTGIAISNTGDFAVSATTCSTSLPAKAKCTISVTFTPTATGKRTGQLSVSDSASNSPQTAMLTGAGT